MHLMIDNYDSFTYNVYQYCKMLNIDLKVVRNDEITLDEIKKMQPESIIISPGPCTPHEAGISVQIIQQLDIPIFGICLGHQCIAHAFGGKVIRAKTAIHGKRSEIIHHAKDLFYDFPEKIVVGRYHSLVVDDLPQDLIATAWVDEPNGEIMALQHRYKPIWGVQFHPESILTKDGLGFFNNYFKMVEHYNAQKNERIS